MHTVVPFEPNHPAESTFCINVVKWDRFRADAIRVCALQAFPGASVTLTYDAIATLTHLRKQPTNLGLIGLTLPDLDGLDLLKAIARERLVKCLLVVTGRHDERTRGFLRTADIQGCFDCVTEGPEALTTAIRQVGTGGRFFSGTWRDPEPGGRTPLSALLTIAELQVFAVIGDGCDDRTGSTRLSLSAHTIRTHRRNIMRKLGLQTRADLMNEALFRGFVRVIGSRVLRPGNDDAGGFKDGRRSA